VLNKLDVRAKKVGLVRERFRERQDTGVAVILHLHHLPTSWDEIVEAQILGGGQATAAGHAAADASGRHVQMLAWPLPVHTLSVTYMSRVCSAALGR
jgi:hypothetical protein